MSTPKDPEHADDEQRPSESPSLSKQTGDTSGEEPAQPLTGAAPAQTPSAQPTEHDPAAARPPEGEAVAPDQWWQPTGSPPAGPLGGQWGAEPSGQPAEPQPWGADSPGGRQSWGAEPAAPGTPLSGSAPQPTDESTHRFTPDEHTRFGSAGQPPHPPTGHSADAEQLYPPTGQPGYPAGGVYGYPPSGQQPPQYGYPSYPQQGYEPYATQPKQAGSQVYSIIGFVCAVTALLFCPFLFGPAGIILGIIGHNKGESLGKWAAIAAAVGMVIGFIVGFAVFGGDLST
ncbi:DUF4190 domain-containing protein [Nocardia gipuzkoensis]|uniref:DUF4190 domain-containing protein n=1 Tax=Nocardia gipuzkoensis TaxID=2749991 RepID=UPI0015EE56CF|nr:DUF4190 domain-containing protein [Nocardia gipuzkoensis]